MTDKIKSHICILSLLALSFIVFGQILTHDFLNFDDDIFVSKNKQVSKGFTWEGIQWAFKADLLYDSIEADYWKPITVLSHMSDVQIYGKNPSGHHLSSLMIHTLSAIFLFIFLLQSTNTVLPSFLASIFFLLHPLQVEVVSWIAARKDLLAVFFSILAALVYAKYVRNPSALKRYLVVLLFILGLMAKPIAAVLPAIFLLFDVWPLKRYGVNHFSWWQSISEKKFLFLLSFVSYLIAKLGQTGVLSERSWSFQQGIIPLNLIYYLKNIFWPANLAIQTFVSIESIPKYQMVGSLLIVLGVSRYVIKKIKTQPYLFTGWFFFLIAFLPTIGLSKADRFAYFPMIGFGILFSWAVWQWLIQFSWGKKLFGCSVVVITSILAILSFLQTRYWKDSLSLFTRAVQVTKGNYQAHNNLGAYYAENGMEEKAIEHLVSALSINPTFTDSHNNLGVVLARQGKFKVAEFHYRRSLEIDPTNSGAQVNLGNILFVQKKWDEAQVLYQKSIQNYPDFAPGYDGLGNIYLIKEDPVRAEFYFRKAISIYPEYADAHYDLAVALSKQKKYDEALLEFERTLRFHPDYTGVHTNMGVIHAEQGRYDQAIHYFKAALLLDPHDKIAKDNMTLAESKKEEK